MFFIKLECRARVGGREVRGGLQIRVVVRRIERVPGTEDRLEVDHHDSRQPLRGRRFLLS
eukprot:1324710-Amorphochlora_amoeboformis.AAC.1